MSQSQQLRSMTHREKQIRGFEILCQFDAFAKKHNLQYWLGYGTLIGAMRHQGFIPWDDDVDVIMLEDDYERLLCLIRNGVSIGAGLEVNSCELDISFQAPFMKIFSTDTAVFETDLLNPEKSKSQGIWVDVFVLKGIQLGKIRTKFIPRLSGVIYSLYRLSNQKLKPGSNSAVSFARKMLQPFCRIMGTVFWQRFFLWFQRFMSCDLAKADHLICFVDSHVFIPKQAIDPQRKRVAVFEGKDFPIPSDTEMVLSLMYHDEYQNIVGKIPPPEKRIQHSTEAYWLG